MASRQNSKRRRGKLTARDRDGNDAADALAKKGAALHRIPRHVRQKVKTAEMVALRAALQLGVTTTAANEHAVYVLDEQGKTRQLLTRDSEGCSVYKKTAEVSSTKSVKNPKPLKEKARKTAEKATKGTRTRKVRGKRKHQRLDVKALGCKKLSTPPTKEWVERQSKELIQAATAESFQFLAAAQGSEAQEEERPDAFFDSVASTDSNWQTRSRPVKAKVKAKPSLSKKQADKAVQKLIGF
jgi:hypothetical protein